jgi:hypothetical protein
MTQDPEAFGMSRSLPPYGPPTSCFRWSGLFTHDDVARCRDLEIESTKARAIALSIIGYFLL